MNWRRCIVTAAMGSMVLFSGCSGDNGNSSKTGVTVAVCGPYVSETAVEELQESLQGAAGEKSVEVIAVSMGDPEKDPMGTTAGTLKLTSMVAAKELDVMLSDFDSAKRNAGNEMYYPVYEIFTEEELSGSEDQFIVFDKLDDDGNPTGEKTDPCGIDVSSNESYKQICGGSSAGVYIISNTTDLESAKSVMQKITAP